MSRESSSRLSENELQAAVAHEGKEFEKSLRWLEEHMPAAFHEEIAPALKILAARSLTSFQLQDRFSQVHFQQMALVLCKDAPDADLKVLKHYHQYGIRYYRTFVSNEPPPGDRKGSLRIAFLLFRDEAEDAEASRSERVEELSRLIRARNVKIDNRTIDTLLSGLTPRFVRSLTTDRLTMALDVFFRAQSRDECQIEMRRNDDWQSKDAPSLQIVLAWRNVPKAGFLYRLAQIIDEHDLALKKVVSTYIDPFSTDSVLILSMGLHGLRGKAAWEEADIDDLLRELCLVKYFPTDDRLHEVFVKPRLIRGNEAYILRNMASFAHQCLVYADPNLYSSDNIIEGFCRHPEITVRLCRLFEAKFDPKKKNADLFQQGCKEFIELLQKLDTGQTNNDSRRKNILKQALNLAVYTLKTNFYLPNKTGFSFRLDPNYLDDLPFDRTEKFPELPFGVFFIKGMHYIGFNIRFKDLARGGVRTVIPDRWESYTNERNAIFSEAYNLAYTQQKKNKDIPEGGAKTAILLAPFDVFQQEEEIYRRDLEEAGKEDIAEKIAAYRKEHKLAYLFASQRSFIESFMTLLNCDEQGKLLAESVVDYWEKPEYIYLGPDENMLNEMIVWIAHFAEENKYKPGRSFISSKPGAGINHKEFGVTSYGVNVCLHQTLLFLGIDPEKNPFSIKISGGPDGDVAGNEIHLLAKNYPRTAKLLALTDVSGTIYDPEGLDWEEMDALFKAGRSIRFYPAEKLHEGGFLLDLQTKKEESAYAQQTLCWKKQDEKAVQHWLSGNEMNHLYRTNVHQTPVDIFMPGGGRPRTLNETNYTSFLDETGRPTAKAIVEGANLYLTPAARKALEKLGVVILKDSSCNKGGVICSSFEVLASLCLTEQEFIQEKKQYVEEVFQIIRKAALNESSLLLETHASTGIPCSDLSDKISERINHYKYQLLDHLQTLTLSSDHKDPLIRCLLSYCPPLLRKNYSDRILSIPDIHKKAIISVFLASHLIYTRGLNWAPSIADVLNQIATDPRILSD